MTSITNTGMILLSPRSQQTSLEFLLRMKRNVFPGTFQGTACIVDILISSFKTIVNLIC